MIAFVNGILDCFDEEKVVIDVNGIGFNVFVTNETLNNLPSTGTNIKLYTYTLVREDAFLLYGFESSEELALFKKLITVNGIGPKGAMSLLSVMSADDLRFAILSGDSAMIAKAPGIGKKTAERVIIDLQDKVTMPSIAVPTASLSQNVTNSAAKEAVAALKALGYGQKEAYEAVSKAGVSDSDDVESIIKNALSYLI